MSFHNEINLPSFHFFVFQMQVLVILALVAASSCTNLQSSHAHGAHPPKRPASCESLSPLKFPRFGLATERVDELTRTIHRGHQTNDLDRTEHHNNVLDVWNMRYVECSIPR